MRYLIHGAHKKRIGVDAGDLKYKGLANSGIKRHLTSFIENVTESRFTKDFLYYYYYFDQNKSNLSDKHKINKKIVVKKIPKKLYGSFFLPVNLWVDKINIFLGFSGFIPYFQTASVKKILFLHDLGFIKFPEYYSDPNRLARITSNSIKRANKIIVFSDYAKSQILSYYNIDPVKIVRLYAGTDHLKKPSKKNVTNIPQSYFLYVGLIKKIKNIEKLFKIFFYYVKNNSKSKDKLLIIGENDDKEYLDSLLRSSDFKKIKHRVIFLKNVSDDDLINYYLKCIAILNFAFEEGFCFPVLEALSLGKVAIVNDFPLYREYKRYFENVSIIKNQNDALNQMIYLSRRNKKKAKRQLATVNKIFNWNRFTQDLHRIIIED